MNVIMFNKLKNLQEQANSIIFYMQQLWLGNFEEEDDFKQKIIIPYTFLQYHSKVDYPCNVRQCQMKGHMCLA